MAQGAVDQNSCRVAPGGGGSPVGNAATSGRRSEGRGCVGLLGAGLLPGGAFSVLWVCSDNRIALMKVAGDEKGHMTCGTELVSWHGQCCSGMRAYD